MEVFSGTLARHSSGVPTIPIMVIIPVVVVILFTLVRRRRLCSPMALLWSRTFFLFLFGHVHYINSSLPASQTDERACMIFACANARFASGIDVYVGLSADCRPFMSTTTEKVLMATNLSLRICDTTCDGYVSDVIRVATSRLGSSAVRRNLDYENVWLMEFDLRAGLDEEISSVRSKDRECCALLTKVIPGYLQCILHPGSLDENTLRISKYPYN
jgi:hypothetical protein